MPLITSPPLSPANLLRLGGGLLSPKNSGQQGGGRTFLLNVESQGLSDLQTFLSEASIPTKQEQPTLVLQAVLTNADGEDVHIDERCETNRLSDLSACFPISAEAGSGPWVFGEAEPILERKLEDTYLQVRILNTMTSSSDSPTKSKIIRQVSLSPPTPQTPQGTAKSPGRRASSASPISSGSPSPTRRASSIQPTNVQIVAQADIPLDSFPKSGDAWGGKIALTEGPGFKARKFACELDIRGTLVLKGSGDDGGFGAGGPKSPMAAMLKKGFTDMSNYFNTANSNGGLSGPLQRQPSKRNRKLSISGRDTSPIVRSPSKQLSRSDSDLGTISSAQEDGATEDLVRHMDSTFNNSLMVISERFATLADKVKQGKATGKEANALPKVTNMVKALGEAARSVSLIGSACDPKIKVRSSAVDPDTIDDGISSAKTILNTLQDRFTMMMRSLKQKMKQSNFDLEGLVLSDDSSVYDNLEAIDDALSDCVEAIDGCSHDLDEKGFPAAATNALMFAIRLKRRGLKKKVGGGKIHPGAGLSAAATAAPAATTTSADPVVPATDAADPVALTPTSAGDAAVASATAITAGES